MANLTLLKKSKPVLSAKNQFEVLFEIGIDALLVVDLETGKILAVNPAAEELTGYLQTELLGQSIELLTTKQSSARARGFDLDLLHQAGLYEDVVLQAKDGHNRYLQVAVKNFEHEGASLSMCVLRDISEKKNMERELIAKHTELRDAFMHLEKANLEMQSMQDALVQSGKLAALGELAAGIAHELNQPLTGIKGYAQEAGSVLETSKNLDQDRRALHGFFREIDQCATKMHKIISHLRGFVSKSTEDYSMVAIQSVIQDSLTMIGRQLQTRGIQVQISVDPTLPEIYCNPFQLEQVFINLLTNARDAIEAKKETRGVVKISVQPLNADCVEIRFEDNGCGMAEQVRTKIFNPFFTTKEVGKGMGLGLSITYGILNKLNASVVVESDVGKGTIFKIRLPKDYRKH